MFTGIVEEIGKIIEVGNSDKEYFKISCTFDFHKVDIGSSISCDGICLTVTKKGKITENSLWFEVNVSDETKKLTNMNCKISPWTPGKAINLERSLKVGDELGGHIVTGHIDATAVVKEIATDKNSHTLKISIPETLHKYITRKGSITLNGTSLTVNDVGNDWFKVNLIPHTNDVTTWKDIETGQLINLEVDILARYVAQILIAR